MERRTFINAALFGAILPFSEAIAEVKKEGLVEPQRTIPIAGDYDVIVCGAGPAGVAAAIEAGRNGAKTLLLEVHGCLGGVWTAGNLTWILDNQNKSGFINEIKRDLAQLGGAGTVDSGSSYAFDAEIMKAILEAYCVEADVTVRLHTRVVSTAVQNGRLTHVLTESKSGREAWAAKIFIDCTGDGDVAQQAGCGYDYGSSEGEGQPMSLLALVGGVHYEDIKPFVRDAQDSKLRSPSKKRLEAEIIRSGVKPSYSLPGLYPIHQDLFMLMANHEYGYLGYDAKQISLATLKARAEVHQIVNGLRSLGGIWQNFRIVSTAEQIGVRESRRIHGLYTVTAEDLIQGARHQDAVCRVTFGVDVHSVKKDDENNKKYNRGVKAVPYDIPIRAMIAKDVEGLMMAGRCISGDFIAHSSYRVTGNSVVMGEAAGRLGAMAAGSNRLPQEVDWAEVKWSL
ncbi:FAD dependent oxidoreductase [Dyadobacter jejuensis]|uniref:FAD dependent oxidoreductase n=1 Tax=Dyadobacter jejuensis TaxID=1082580 RepID=A0A316AMQ3_9BACT|nr:FAD-dependent oxidoreductase [Dyadobacter jejuensis]PWJ58579.1 FAD dependent oxidoreductase [Dyadobacter jejuensis]